MLDACTSEALQISVAQEHRSDDLMGLCSHHRSTEVSLWTDSNDDAHTTPSRTLLTSGHSVSVEILELCFSRVKSEFYPQIVCLGS